MAKALSRLSIAGLLHVDGERYRYSWLALTAAPLACVALTSGVDAADPVRVSVVTAKAIQNTVSVTLTGSIQARVQSDLAFRVAGKIVTLKVDVGQHVTKGAVLATLDDAQERADVDSAKAQLASQQAILDPAQVDLDRQKQLFANGFATKKRLDDSQATVTRSAADVRAAEASLASAEEQLGYTVLTSTGDGVIVARSVDVGEVVQTGAPVITLALDGPRDAVFDIAESTAAGRPPQDAIIKVALTADPSVQVTGHVREIAPQVDSSTNTVKVKVGLDAAPPAITLGAAVTGSAELARRPSTPLPWSALDRWGGKPAVWVLGPDDKASAHPVSVVRYRTGGFDVDDGLQDGDRVVSAGVQFLRPGTPVVVSGGKP